MSATGIPVSAARRNDDKMSENNEIQKFVNDQLSCWPLACANFRALKSVKIKTLTVGGLEVTVQHNPARMISSAAKLDRDSVAKRPCFFCNRYPEQTFIRFEGRKGKKYDILLNPFPIFPDHLVIAMTSHCEQSIWKRYIDILDLSRKYQSCTFFYNGPHSGASAPDHHHFQAAPCGLMPLEKDVRSMISALRASSGKPSVPFPASEGSSATVPELVYLASVQDARLYHYDKFVNGIFVLRATTSKSAAKLFYRLLDCADTPERESEPLFNLISWYDGGEYCSIVVFRTSHRSHHYFSTGPDHLTMSPGCADMCGCFIAPVQEDFEKLDSALLTQMLDEVTVSRETQGKIIRRLTRTQPHISVGIMSAPRIEFKMYPDGGGTRVATWREGKIDYDGALYDELFFEEQTPSTFFAEPTFELHDVTIGKGFHWERRETQKFAGTLKIIVEDDMLTAVNVIGVEDYLLSVISSEMNQNSPEEFLKAHAVISRSWVMAQLGHRRSPSCDAAVREGLLRCGNIAEVVTWLSCFGLPGGSAGNAGGTRHAAGEGATGSLPAASKPSADGTPAGKSGVPLSYVKWYDHTEHRRFDVCADDHCQRYQGITSSVLDNVKEAVQSTRGQVLMYGNEICDARFSKCCGGVTERYGACWEDKDLPYLQPARDTWPEEALPDLTSEDEAERWIMSAPAAFCNSHDGSLLRQVLNSYDQETSDFYRWHVTLTQAEVQALLKEKLGIDFGYVLRMVPVKRSVSGRLETLRIEGTLHTMTIGKELEIRRSLSPTHLYSSAFIVRTSGTLAVEGCTESIPAQFELFGAGWGHGVGMCQIGAAVMSNEGHSYERILSHYYHTAQLTPLYKEKQ